MAASQQEQQHRMERFRELDMLRGIAALAVVLFHYSIHTAKYFGDFPFRFEPGKYGVSLFFCVSGFVIFWTLERSRTLADFAFSRFSRLYPTYWAAILLWGVVSVGFFGERFWPGGYAANLTMLQTFVGVTDLDVAFWTLAVELVFYVWMALFFRLGLLKHILPIGVFWLLVSAVWVLAGEPALLRTYLILPYIPYFIAGIVFYRARAGWRREYALMILLAGLVLVVHNGALGGVIAAVCFAAMFAAISGWLSWAVNPVTVMLGTVSYALYVTHNNIGAQALNRLHDAGVPSVVSVPLMIAVAVGIAAAVTYGVEHPAMRWLRNQWKAWRRPTVVEIREKVTASH